MKCRKPTDEIDEKTLMSQTCSEEAIPHTGFCGKHYMENCQGKVGAVQVLLLNDIRKILMGEFEELKRICK